MKKLSDIEDLSFEDILRISEDEKIEVPLELHQEINLMIDSLEFLNEKEEKRCVNVKPLWANISAVAVVVGVVLAVAWHKNQPVDTFSDPALAYAQIEKTFSYMSEKMNVGLEKAAEAESVFDKTGDMINEITNK
jgi:hypothetical protein